MSATNDEQPATSNPSAPLRTGEQSGETRLRAAIRRHSERILSLSKDARDEDPRPYDDDWGWWIEQRLSRLETSVKWLIGLAAATLAAEVIRIALAALSLPAP